MKIEFPEGVEIERAGVIEVRDGDTVVLTLRRRVSYDAMGQLAATIREHFPPTVKVMVLDDCEIKVLRPSEGA